MLGLARLTDYLCLALIGGLTAVLYNSHELWDHTHLLCLTRHNYMIPQLKTDFRVQK